MADVTPPDPVTPVSDPSPDSGDERPARPVVPPIVPDLDLVPSAPPSQVVDPATPSPAGGVAPRSRRRLAVVLGIVAAGLGAAALLVGAAVGVGSLVGGIVTPKAPDQPIIAGAPGDPVAAQPLDCPTACFDETSLEALTVPSETFARLGLTEVTELSSSEERARVGELVARDQSGWLDYDGGPDECFFAPTSAPYATTFDAADPASDDLIAFLGSYDDTVDLGDQSVRIFPDSASASAYLAELAQAIEACEAIEIGPEDDRYTATVSPAAALSLPSEVAAVGWIREGQPGPRWRAYVIDLQRGNVVVRIRILTDGVITERQFRNTVERYADQLATAPTVTANVAP